MQGPFFDAVQEEGRLEGDDEREAGAGDADLAVTEIAVENDDPGRILERIDKMKNDELRKELQRRSCSAKGRKAELVARLREAVKKKLPLAEEMSAEVQGNLAGDGFALGARWELQEPDDVDVKDESQRVIDSISFREPIVGIADVLQGVQFAKKKNYRMVLDRPPFISSCRQPKIVNGRLVYEKNGKCAYRNAPHTNTLPNVDFFHRRGINTDSHPADWYNCFFPIKRIPSDEVSAVSIAEITSWTNKKALLDNAGAGGRYRRFHPFSIKEIMRHFGLYMLNGVAPSPQVEMKFVPQEQDQANGNDLCFRVFGRDALTRHKQFKAFLSAVDPIKPVPERKQHPNWKCNPVLKHAINVSKNAMHMGEKCSIDEQTIGCKGRHPDIIRINYKREGDGFQCDALCSDGYTFTFFFRNQPSPKKWIEKGLSPLHSRCMALIEQLPNKYHKIYIDNLYSSARFTR